MERVIEGGGVAAQGLVQSISSESLLRRASASSSEKVLLAPRGSSGQVGSMPASGSERGKVVIVSSFKERERERELMAMLSFNTNSDEIAKTGFLISPAPGINLQLD